MTSPDSPPLQHLPGLSLEVSARFDFADADVTFQSSDSILFRVHRKNLEVCTEGFPPSGFAVTEGELSETSVTLELLFQFIYPQRHPGLDATPFDVLEPLAEAAEKYQVFPAMNICHIRLRDMVHEHPVEVAIYAAKHDYPFLISEVAPMMISIPPIDVIQILPQSLVLPWTRYIQEWVRVHQNVALKLFSGQTPQYNKSISHAGGMPQSRQYPRVGGNNGNIHSQCCWPSCVTIVLQHLGAGIHTLRSLDQVFHMGINHEDVENCCDWELLEWRRKIEEAIAQIPKFSAFL
ncbi:hypothetical protein C8F04DRAFT_1039007 [Mycena alexandri]|uniref:BTB domain-containing protein n=1 Tax=Mycena alexandri TaxID=1745969 RepID=A0AAD6SU42_9AGAR|nr:hypothetical protein C8F04DRAFT_1039007 [Mycena alexandri]